MWSTLPQRILGRVSAWHGIRLAKENFHSYRLRNLYDQVLNGTYEQNIGINPPFQETVTITGTRLDQPLPTGQTPQLRITSFNLNTRDSDELAGSHATLVFDIQHQLNEKTMITAGYFGSKGTHLIGAFELNELPLRARTQNSSASSCQ